MARPSYLPYREKEDEVGSNELLERDVVSRCCRRCWCSGGGGSGFVVGLRQRRISSRFCLLFCLLVA